eukprot:1158605-Pelagomonas_calceolata.AAC.7
MARNARLEIAGIVSSRTDKLRDCQARTQAQLLLRSAIFLLHVFVCEWPRLAVLRWCVWRCMWMCLPNACLICSAVHALTMRKRVCSSGALEPTQAADTRNNLRNFIFTCCSHNVRVCSSGALEPTQAADTRNNLRNFIFKQQKKLMEAGKSEASHMIVRARSMHET